jgi:hypothetical protein
MHNANPNLENELKMRVIKLHFMRHLREDMMKLFRILVENKADVNTRDKVH